jgi:3-phenylpropionate/cinnamic acid dioxygenase small subunit
VIAEIGGERTMAVDSIMERQQIGLETLVLRCEVENLLYQEARLMDEHRFDDWLALWTADLLYWVPSNVDNADPKFHINIIYDNRSRLEDRLARMKSGAAWSQDPPSRMRRVIGNIEIEPAIDGDITVYSNFNLSELRRSIQDTYAGRTIHTLRREGETLKIAMKKVLLLMNDEVIDNLTFLM